jgi:hypothetical protein
MITRRELLLTILAAPIVPSILTPTITIPECLDNYLYDGAAGGGKTAYMKLYGVPYYESNASSGEWIGIPRINVVRKDLCDLITQIKGSNIWEWE